MQTRFRFPFVVFLALSCALVLLLAACSTTREVEHLGLQAGATVPVPALLAAAQDDSAVQFAVGALATGGHEVAWDLAVASTAPDLEAYVDLPDDQSMVLVPITNQASATLALGFQGSELTFASLIAMGWDGLVDICHYPPGNLANAHTITVPQESLKAHIANHDDVIGPCDVDREQYVSQKTMAMRLVDLFGGQITEVTGDITRTAGPDGQLVTTADAGTISERTYGWATVDDIVNALDFTVVDSLFHQSLVAPQDHCAPHPLYCPDHPSDGEGGEDGEDGNDSDGPPGGGDGDAGGGGSDACEVPASMELDLDSARSSRTGANIGLFLDSADLVASTGALGVCVIPGANALGCWGAVGNYGRSVGTLMAGAYNARSAALDVRAREAEIDEWVEENCIDAAGVPAPVMHAVAAPPEPWCRESA